jgi:hypothetical protein
LSLIVLFMILINNDYVIRDCICFYNSCNY